MQHPQRIEPRTENLEPRVDRIEHILPILATKEDLKATEEQMRMHVTNVEERMRTHFDVVTEGLRHDIQLVAEAVAVLSERER